MLQGDLPRDQKLDVGIFLLFLTYNEVPRDYKRKLDVELDVGFIHFIRHMIVQGELTGDQKLDVGFFLPIQT